MKVYRKYLIGLISLAALVGAWYLFDFDGRLNFGLDEGSLHPYDSTEAMEEEVPEYIPVYHYGMFNKDSFEVVEGIVKQNQLLPNLLEPYGVSYANIDRMGRQLKDTFDVRKMRVGQPFAVFLDKDSPTPKIHYFVYEVSKREYVVYDFRDSLVTAQRGFKPRVIETRQIAGTINSSLYLTLDKQDANPYLAIKMSEVFAWAIDFYRIQKGDWFKVIYEEEFVDGQSIGIGRIHAALFNHYGKDYYAIYFQQDSLTRGDYFDQNNNSCRRAFLKAPLKFSRISSPYSMKRLHPVTGRVKPHLGTDYAAARGTPILATSDGVVIEAAYTSGNGNYVKIRHNSIYTTQYLHMSGFAKGMKKNIHVSQGQVIGYVGSTGLATGPHVCYRFWKNGVQVDAQRVDIPPSEPVKAENLAAYEKVKKEMIEKLAAIAIPGDEIALRSE